MADQLDAREHIVTGVDGSESARQALAWAVRQTELTGGVLEAVTAWDFPQFHGALEWLPPVNSGQEDLVAAARQELEQAVRDAIGNQPSVEVRTTVRYGPAAGVLLDAARDASLLVVGSRGLGGFTGLMLGSVAQHCVQNATCPVVVVREDERTDDRTDGR
jgi:nucleotide-binding universal stress UspA family protein